MNLSVSYTVPSSEIRAWFDHSTSVTFSKRLSGLDIIRIVCEATGVRENEFLSQRRNRHIAEARFVAWRLMRAYTELSYPQIGRLCNRDHTTILSGVKKADMMLGSHHYTEFQRTYQKVTGILREFV